MRAGLSLHAPSLEEPLRPSIFTLCHFLHHVPFLAMAYYATPSKVLPRYYSIAFAGFLSRRFPLLPNVFPRPSEFTSLRPLLPSSSHPILPLCHFSHPVQFLAIPCLLHPLPTSGHAIDSIAFAGYSSKCFRTPFASGAWCPCPSGHHGPRVAPPRRGHASSWSRPPGHARARLPLPASCPPLPRPLPPPNPRTPGRRASRPSRLPCGSFIT